MQRENRDAAEHDAWRAAQTGDEYTKLMAEGTRYGSQEDWRRAAKAFRGAIALRPDKPVAYYNLGTVLSNSGHAAEAAQRYLEAKERYPVGSEDWAEATANAFDVLRLPECAEVAKPEWWNDEGLKALSARVVRAAPNEETANNMRAVVLCGVLDAWKAGLRSAAELREAATHYQLASTLSNAPVAKASFARKASLAHKASLNAMRTAAAARQMPCSM